jgi:hypothetical protein
LDEHFDDFRASEYEIREKYVRHFAREFLPRSPGLKNKEKESTKVIEKRRNIETVRAFSSATSGCSQIISSLFASTCMAK